MKDANHLAVAGCACGEAFGRVTLRGRKIPDLHVPEFMSVRVQANVGRIEPIETYAPNQDPFRKDRQ